MLLPLDFWIFGNGKGFAAPYWNQTFHWLNGELYTFQPGLGAQLHSVQWTHPKAGERRRICDVEFRPLHSHRRWGRVKIAWEACSLPTDLNQANNWLDQFANHISRYPALGFAFRIKKDNNAKIA